MRAGLLVFALTFSTPICFAQDEAPPFLGLVQYVSGQVSWVERPKRKLDENVKFKSFLHHGDTLKLNSKAQIKIVTAQRCVGVLYGPGKLSPPRNEYSNEWTFEGTGLRWICKGFQTQSLRINGRSFVVSGGEFLISKNLLYVYNNQLSTKGGEFKKEILYHLKSNNWTVASKDKKEIYRFHETFRAPKEATKLEQPRDEGETSRWIISTGGGPMNMDHANGDIKLNEVSSEMTLATFHYKSGKGSLIGSFGIMDFENPDSEDCSSGGCSQNTDPSQYNEGENLILELGYRTSHKRNWSWFWKLGLQEMKYRINYNQFEINDPNIGSDDVSYFINREEVYLATSVHFGIDYLWRFGFWDNGGMYFGADAYFMTTLTHLETNNNCDHADPNNGQCENEPPGFEPTDTEITLTGFNFLVGLMLRF